MRPLVRPSERAVLPAQGHQPPLLARLQPRRVLQQRIAHPLELLGLLAQPMLLCPPHLIERVGRQAFDVEPVEDHPRVRHPRPQRLLPARRQIRRHQLDPFTAGRPQQVEERLQRLGTAPLPAHTTRRRS